MQLNLTIERAVSLNANTKLYELSAIDGRPLPASTAGAHLSLSLADRFLRSFSLLDHNPSPSRYRVAVKRNEFGRGGSKWVHENWRPGISVSASPPLNNFPLLENAENSVLLAGGIGITPIFSMYKRLLSLGRRFELFACFRAKDDAIFLDDLSSQTNVHTHFDDAANCTFSIEDVLRHYGSSAQYYCCGPSAMLDEFQRVGAALHYSSDQLHLERFGGLHKDDGNRSFHVTFARSNISSYVSETQTILDVAIAANIPVDFICREGVCGTCRTAVISGKPDHRDYVLSEAERAKNDQMMICCSRSISDSLTLDM